MSLYSQIISNNPLSLDGLVSSNGSSSSDYLPLVGGTLSGPIIYSSAGAFNQLLAPALQTVFSMTDTNGWTYIQFYTSAIAPSVPANGILAFPKGYLNQDVGYNNIVVATGDLNPANGTAGIFLKYETVSGTLTGTINCMIYGTGYRPMNINCLTLKFITGTVTSMLIQASQININVPTYSKNMNISATVFNPLQLVITGSGGGVGVKVAQEYYIDGSRYTTSGGGNGDKFGWWYADAVTDAGTMPSDSGMSNALIFGGWNVGVRVATPLYATAVVATGNPALTLGTTTMWMSVESSSIGVLGAGLYGTNYYPISYRGKTHQWQCDGVDQMNLSSTFFNVANTVANIYAGSRSGALLNMAFGSLTIGSTNKSYGGGSGWNANTAGLLFETNNNTEIQVHHSGYNITSLLYYNGGNQQIYIGRDSGWGAKPLNIQGSLVCNSGSAFNADVGVNANLYAKSVIISGGGSYVAGCIYTDSNWGMLFRATQYGAINAFNFRTSDGTEVMSITQSGNMGLGVTYPSAKLDVRGPMIVRQGDYSTCTYGPNSSYNSYLLVGAGHGSSQVDGQTACMKTTNGNLHLDCAVGYSMYLNYYTNGFAYAITYYFGGFAYGSDARYKENIITANNELCYNNIKKIRIVRYNFIKDSVFDRCTGNDKSRLGVLAQDLEKIYPNSVTETKDPETGKPFKAVDTRQMYYTLVGCVQQLQKTVEEQQQQIIAISKHMAEMTAQLNKLTLRDVSGL